MLNCLVGGAWHHKKNINGTHGLQSGSEMVHIVARLQEGHVVMQYLKNAVNTGRCYVDMPVRAMSWEGLSHFYLFISLVIFFVVISFYSVGLTPVLPFSGNLLLTFGAVFYLTHVAALTIAGQKRSSRMQELSIIKVLKQTRPYHDQK